MCFAVRFGVRVWRSLALPIPEKERESKDDPVTDDVVPSDFSLEEKPREITGSNNGN
jgi:hypothetical protein